MPGAAGAWLPSWAPGLPTPLHSTSSTVLTNEWPKGRCQGRDGRCCVIFFFFIICLCVARPPFWSIEKSFFWRGGNAKRETQKEQVMQEDKQVAANGQDDGF